MAVVTETYAAQITNGLVAQVIVGTAEWANTRLDGTWIDSDILVGIGWTWDETNGFQPPATPEPPTE